MKSSGKRKLSLMWTIISSLAMVGTASVATFAWFQASAAASVQTASTSTTITVNKPNEHAFYAYKGNRDPSHSLTNTFSTDFTTITSSNAAEETDLSSLSNGFYPGRSFVFAVSVSELSEGDPVALKTVRITSNNTTKQGISQSRQVRTGSIPINIGFAVNIHSMATDTNSGYGAFTTNDPSTSAYKTAYPDKFDYSDAAPGTLNSAGSAVAPAFALSLTLYTGSISSGYTEKYIFYRVVFSNENATLYKEVNSSGVEQKTAPESGPRYFDKYTSGSTAGYTSNCYAGLGFALNELELDLD